VNQKFGSPVLFYLCGSLLLKNSNHFSMSQQPFKKFINPKNNAAIKEKHKQDKKIAKKERAAGIERYFEEKSLTSKSIFCQQFTC